MEKLKVGVAVAILAGAVSNVFAVGGYGRCGAGAGRVHIEIV